MIYTRPLTADSFAPYGDVLALKDHADKIINQGKCGRHHDLAKLDIIAGDSLSGKVGISLFQSELRSFPYQLDMMERHPLGSQAFIPMSMDGFLVIVAPDDGGKPALPEAFITEAGQGINFHRNIWHGVLTPISGTGLFAVIDRIGVEANLEEYWFEKPYIVSKV